MLVGYARVSTIDQNLDLQIDALQAAGCERTFNDRTSGARTDRPGLREALAFARDGDLLVVWGGPISSSAPSIPALARRLIMPSRRQGLALGLRP